jgi:O-antigen/teichoic acid export membrane protein
MAPAGTEQAARDAEARVAADRESGELRDLKGGFLRPFVAGLSWTGAARGVASVLTAARYVLFARMLRPFDFGVFGAAMLVSTALGAFTDPRMGHALIQQEGKIEPYFDTLFTTYLVRSLIISVILVVSSHQLAAFFRLGNQYPVFWAIAPLTLIQGIQSPRIVFLYRRLDFHLVTILNGAEVSASLIFGLAAVWYFRDWRGLVLSALAGSSVRLVLTYWYFPHLPRLRFNREFARTMLSFGLWFGAGTFSEYVAKQLDNLMVGHLLGPKLLGTYQMAFRAGEMPVAEFTNATSLVTFPMVARLRKDPKTRRRFFTTVVAVVTLVGLAYSAFIITFGSQIVLKLFGPQWVHAIVPLKVLCIYGVLQGWLVVGRSFLAGLGKPKRYVAAAVTRAGVLAIIIYPLTLWHGLTGAASAGVISLAVALPVLIVMLLQTDREVTPSL